MLADDVTELGAKVALAPVGSPVALSVAVHPPPDPVNAICTDVPALAPYWVDWPRTTGLGVWAPSTCKLLTWSIVVNEMSDCVHVVALNLVRTRAYRSLLAGRLLTDQDVGAISPVSSRSAPPGVVQ